MPLYDFKCKECQETFSLAISIKSYEEKNYSCPRCGSRNLEQQVSPFYAITSKKS